MQRDDETDSDDSDIPIVENYNSEFLMEQLVVLVQARGVR